MTVVTTSRKAAHDLRALARHLAFATGARYMPRGKTGFAALGDEPVIVFSREHGKVRLQIVEEGTIIFDALVGKVTLSEREGPIVRTLRVSDQSVYDVLKRYCEAELVEAAEPLVIYDGQQKKRVVLEVVPDA
ncbi:hypothetical protein RJ40_10190 [Methanofollis aquaemaris]|uniref:Uncharacterized protein n=1 Tax=Methanofollis aquaemaris TaxID=126734 RepID=A0A8A3S7C8_9EURY|nr:hypothetical protein [Methanofollis aquaemaris]QSZ67843.1 hypothetical protein RJ40_10190 [Methanofollis aquaemaris]